jgi:hypothetical protein
MTTTRCDRILAQLTVGVLFTLIAGSAFAMAGRHVQVAKIHQHTPVLCHIFEEDAEADSDALGYNKSSRDVPGVHRKSSKPLIFDKCQESETGGAW